MPDMTTTIRVAGTAFHQADLMYLKPKTEIQLVREPKNAFDKNAIAVKNGDATLGYIPRDVASEMARLIDTTGVVPETSVEVCEKYRDHRSGKAVIGLTIRVTIRGVPNVGETPVS